MKLPKTNLNDGFSIEARSDIFFKEKGYIGITQENHVSMYIKVEKGFIVCSIDYHHNNDVDFILYDKLTDIKNVEDFKKSFEMWSDWWKKDKTCECDFKRLNEMFKPLFDELDRMIEEAEKE